MINQYIEMKILAACHSHGVPTLLPFMLSTTRSQVRAGSHYGYVRGYLESEGYDDPFVIIDEQDMNVMDKFLRGHVQVFNWPNVDKIQQPKEEE